LHVSLTNLWYGYFWAAAVACDVITSALIVKSELRTRERVAVPSNQNLNSAGDRRKRVEICSRSSQNILCTSGT